MNKIEKNFSKSKKVTPVENRLLSKRLERIAIRECSIYSS